MPAAASASSCSTGDNEPWMLAPISPTSRRSLTANPLTLVSHQTGKPENRVRDKCNDRQCRDHRPHERHRVANDRPQRRAGNCRTDEQKQPVGWRNQADHDVKDRDHTEMNKIDAERLGGRYED